MSSKVASTCAQKWLTIFCQKAQKFAKKLKSLYICGPNTYQIMYGETLDFLCHKMCDGKIIFCNKF